MTLGAARVQWNIVDLSQFVDEIVRGYVFVVAQTQRGPVATPKVISSLDEYALVFGLKTPESTDPLVIEMGLRQGARFIISRAIPYDNVHDPTSTSALKSECTLYDRGDVPLPARVTAAQGPYHFTQALSGRAAGSEVGPYTFGTGASDKFKVKIGAHDAQTVTLTGELQTASEVVDQINAGTDYLTASVTAQGKVKLVANTVTDDLEIQAVTHDAYSVLGFSEGIFEADAGTDSLIIKVNKGTNQTFTLLPAGSEEGSFSLTATQVANQLSDLDDARATVINGALRLSTISTGTGAYIQVVDTGTAQEPLDIATTEKRGSLGTSVQTLKLTAADPGTWGDHLKIQISESPLNPEDRFNLKVIHGLQGDRTEWYGDLSMDSSDQRYVVNYINERSRLVTVEDLDSANDSPADRPAINLNGTAMTGGDDGGAMDEASWIGDATYQTGMYSSDKNFYMSMDLMIPGTTSVTVYQAMIAYCEQRQDMMCYGQTPFGLDPEETVDWRMGNEPWGHPAFNSHRFALYFGRPYVYDDMDDSRKFIPCLGHLASCLANTDNRYGYQFAPAGPRRGKVTLMEDIDFNIQGYRSTGWADLFAENGINYLFISHIPGIEGGMFWEQRTTWRPASALRELNVMRFITMLYRAIMPVLRTFLFEPNHPVTWREVHRILEPAFQEWKDRYAIYDFALQTDKDAFFDGGVLKNAYINSGLDIDRGIYHCRGLIQPTRTIYYLQFDLGVMRTGEAFENYLTLKQLPGWVVG